MVTKELFIIFTHREIYVSYGSLVAIVGMDYAGKTTVVQRLRRDLPSAVFVREPGGTALAEEVRRILKSDEFADMTPVSALNLFFAAREDLITKVINPALKAGKLVIADRFDACTWAYQIIAAKRPELRPLFVANRKACIVDRRILPFYIQLDLKPEQAMARSQHDVKREKDHRDSKGVEHYRAVWRGYRSFFSTFRPTMYTVNADIDPEGVYQQVEKAFSLATDGTDLL